MDTFSHDKVEVRNSVRGDRGEEPCSAKTPVEELAQAYAPVNREFGMNRKTYWFQTSAKRTCQAQPR